MGQIWGRNRLDLEILLFGFLFLVYFLYICIGWYMFR